MSAGRGGALVGCTIVAKNYLAYARVLARSFLAHHPDGRFVVLLVDRVDGWFDPGEEPFDVLEVEELDNVPALRQFLFKYNLLELSTAVKPYLLQRLFDDGAERVLYLDPDIWVLRPLLPVLAGLDSGAVVLTPHIDRPLDDDAHPGEIALLQAGLYNLGFIGLRASAESARLLAWWQERLFDQCVERVDQGLFVDQKWMDLAPLLFDGVVVLRQPGLNVAYWNLAHRVVTVAEVEAAGDIEGQGREQQYLVNGESLYFFHFSGINPERLDGVSKHQDRFRLSDLDAQGSAGELYRRYAGLVLAEGYRHCRSWPYAFDSFDNGVRVPDLARSLFLSLDSHRRRRFEDPFRSTGTGQASFFDWMNGPRRSPPYLSRLQRFLLRSRNDIGAAFPDAQEAGAGMARFRVWLGNEGRFAHGIDPQFAASLGGVGGAEALGVRNWLARLYRSRAGVALRAALRRLIGRKFYARLRRRLIGDPPVPASAAGASAFRAPMTPAPAIRVEDELGVNLIGYLQAETGMGEAARGLARALRAAHVPITLQSVELGVVGRRQDLSFAVSRSDFRHDVNLLVVNADQVEAVARSLGPEVFAHRWNVGYWLWELERFPDRYRRAFSRLCEVWTPSRFCLDAFSAVSPVPVRRAPIPVVMPRPAPLAQRDPPPVADVRERLGLPADRFLFLFTFSHLSYAGRKNPLAVVEAFRRAFPDSWRPGASPRPLLVLKSAEPNFEPEASAALRGEVEEGRVAVVARYLGRAETDDLTAAANCYVSLHRSEGFGLTIAEAMACGTPVVATRYGGVTDFLDSDVGFPVRYDRVELERDEGPYPAGATWAEPDVDHAAEQMRRVFENRDEAARRAERARSRVARDFSYEVVGEKLKRLLAALHASLAQ